MMNRKTTEHFWYGLALLLAVILRFANLGGDWLGDGEALQALQSLNLANGLPQLIGSQPGYVLPTAGLFFVAGASEFWARFWPALAGCVLVLAPWLFRHRLGKPVALVTAFLLALDPGLLALARRADGAILALCGVLLAAGFLSAGKTRWAGVCLGLALLSGPAVWPALLSLGLAVWVIDLPQKKQAVDVAEDLATPPAAAGAGRRMLPWLAGTLLLGGTLFMIFPSGLSAMFSGLLAYVGGWGGGAPAASMSQLLLFGVTYQPLILVFGLAGIGYAWFYRNVTGRLLLTWWGIALLLALVYPARQALDVCWATIPLCALAAQALVRQQEDVAQALRSIIITDEEEQTDLQAGIWGKLVQRGMFWMQANLFSSGKIGVLIQALLVLVTFGSMWLVALGGLNPVQGNVDTQLRLAAFGAMFLVLVIGTFLVVAGWNAAIARSGLVMALGGLLVLSAIGAGWRAMGGGPDKTAELWRASGYPQEADLLVRSMQDASEWRTGRRDTLDVVVVGEAATPSLRWQLRQFNNVQYVDILATQSRPALVITAGQQQIEAVDAYRGQDFVWSRTPAWSLVAPAEWIRWWIYRDVIMDQVDVVLWVRADVFSGRAGQAQ